MKTPTGESDPPTPLPAQEGGGGDARPLPQRFPPLPRARGRPTSRRACALSEAACAEETLQAHPPRYSWQPPARLLAARRRGPHPDLAADLGADFHGSAAGGRVSTARRFGYLEPAAGCHPAA